MYLLGHNSNDSNQLIFNQEMLAKINEPQLLMDYDSGKHLEKQESMSDLLRMSSIFKT